jgi:predicted phage terminase large subunit-like protein
MQAAEERAIAKRIAHRELAKYSFADFCTLMVPSMVIAPHTSLKIAKMEALARGDITHLMINEPPQHGKSLLCQLFAAWMLGQYPDTAITLASYGQELADRNSRATRGFVSSLDFPWFDEVKLAADSRAVNRWNLERHRGFVYAVGVNAGLTGWSSDLMIADDLVASYADAKSETVRESAWDWWVTSALTRMGRDPKVLAIGTRWHQDDVLARMLTAGDGASWVVLNLPALSEGEGDPLGRPAGAALWPGFKDETALARLKADMGSMKFSALYQGSPVPAEGELFKREWFERRYTELPYPVSLQELADHPWQAVMLSEKPFRKPLTFVQGIDGAFSTRVGADFSAIITWATDGDQFYLADIWRDRVEYVDLRKVVQMMYWKWKPAYVMCEDSSSGTALISDLQKSRVPVVGIRARGSKEARAELITPIFESGKCHFPHASKVPLIDDFIAEHLAFPAGKHDDLVDASVIALVRVREIIAQRQRSEELGNRFGGGFMLR